MLLLPKTVGPFTLTQKLGTGGVAESYQGTLDAQGGRQVVVRRILPYILRDASRLASAEARVRDLLGVRHPFLVQVLDWVADAGDRYIVEDWVDGVDLERVLNWCRSNRQRIPHNVFLNLATQVCNGLEALHGRPGKGSGSDNVLHLGLKPSAIFLTRDGKVMLGGYGLTRSPTSLPHGGASGPVPMRMEYLSPEQTHSDQKLSPSSDIFSLGALLYELLTLEPLFRSESNLQTINRVRRAEVTTQLLRIKELMPGLDKVLYRALSLNPRHRYQRAFVLREDLRGLMAGYSFNTIIDDTRSFLAPLFDHAPTPGRRAASLLEKAPDAPMDADAFDDMPVTSIDPDPMSTAALAAQALAARAAQDRSEGRHQETEPSPPARSPEEATEGITPETSFGELTDVGRVGTGEEFHTAPPRPVAPIIAAPDVPDFDSTRGRITAATPPPSPPASMAAPDEAIDPNSTRGFLRGHEAAPPEAPSTEPRQEEAKPPPTEKLPLPSAAAPAAPAVDPAVTAARPKPNQSDRLAASAPPPPSGNRSDRLAAAAPPPGRARPKTPPHTDLYRTSPAPAPAPAPAARPPQSAATPKPAPKPAPPRMQTEEEDLDWRPKRRTGMWVGIGIGTIAVVLLCSGTMGGVGILGAGGGGVLGGVFSSHEEITEDVTAEIAADGSDEATADAADAEATDPDADTEAGTADGTDGAAQTGTATDAADAAPDEPEPAVASTKTSAASSSSSSGSSYGSGSSSGSAASTGSSGASSYGSGSSSGSSYSGSSTGSSSYGSSTPASSGREAVADASFDGGEDSGEVLEALQPSALDRYAKDADRGNLGSSDIMYLEMVAIDEPAYTRSRALLLMNAQRDGDSRATKRYLDELMMLPENRYNPVFLADLSRYHVNRGNYQSALDNAILAERYWARLPSELVFSKKAEIFEVQAAAYQGLFYKSEDDLSLLDQAIRHWEKYRNHVKSKARSDLSRRADKELTKLEDIRGRLQ